MIEVHGWITLRESTDPEDEELNLGKIIEQIDIKNKSLQWNNIKVKGLIGKFYLEFTIIHNRKTSKVDECMEYIEYIGSVAPGSYGIIYMLDDEDINGKENEFQVFALARGKIKKYKDSYLSPFIPTVEDEE